MGIARLTATFTVTVMLWAIGSCSRDLSTPDPTEALIQEAAGGGERCGIRRVIHRVKHPECAPAKMLSVACTGQCGSYAQYSPDLKAIVTQCQCCQPTERVVRRVRMLCREDSSANVMPRLVPLMLPTACLCRPCSDYADHTTDSADPGGKENQVAMRR